MVGSGYYRRRTWLYYVVVAGLCVALFLVLSSFLGFLYSFAISVGLFIAFIIPAGGREVRVLLVLFLISAIISFAFITGETGIAKRGWIGLGDLSLESFKAKMNEYVNLLEAKLYGYGEWKNPDVIEKKKPVGVKIKSIVSKGFFVSEEEEVEIRADVMVYGLKEISPKVRFYCEIEDENGNMKEAKSVEVFGEESNEVLVPVGEDRLYTIRCKFGVMKLNKENDVRKVSVKAIYSDFVTRSNILVYTLNEEIIKQIGDVNPFKYFGIYDRENIDSDGIAIPHKQTMAPVEIWLNIPIKQPFIEGVNYFVGMRLYNDRLWWGGKLKKLKYLSLIYPETITRGEDCDLDEDLVLIEGDFNGINKKLEKDEFGVKDINNLKYFCDFNVVKSGDVPESSLIRAQLVYDYEFSKSSSVTLVSKQVYEGM